MSFVITQAVLGLYLFMKLRSPEGIFSLLNERYLASTGSVSFPRMTKSTSAEPVISCLEAVTFFRVSKLTHCRPERQCNPARCPKPCKRQTAPAAGHGWQLPQWTTGSPNIYDGIQVIFRISSTFLAFFFHDNLISSCNFIQKDVYVFTC